MKTYKSKKKKIEKKTITIIDDDIKLIDEKIEKYLN